MSKDLIERSATKQWRVSQRCSANARRRRRYKSLDKKGRTSPPGLCSVSSGRLDHAAMQHGSFGAMSAASHDFVASVNPRRFRAAWQMFRAPSSVPIKVKAAPRVSSIYQLLVKPGVLRPPTGISLRSEEHTSEIQSLMRTSYAVLC